ncbi:hypothetical protein, partial [Aneurinibacillus danicus]|uniref:hypothetical protein n=1 Tax=Aneurinibacillus danicus TaxID=267746 RepID=UPI001C3F624F
FYVGVAAEMPWWFSVKTDEVRGRRKAKAMEGRKKWSLFLTSALPFFQPSYLLPHESAIPAFCFHIGACGWLVMMVSCENRWDRREMRYRFEKVKSIHLIRFSFLTFLLSLLHLPSKRTFYFHVWIAIDRLVMFGFL